MKSIFLSHKQLFENPLPLFRTVGTAAQASDLAMITALVLSVTGKYGLTGFSTAVLIANAARAAIVTLFGLYMVGRKKNEV